STEITAQVIIKEKVEINPLGNILPDYPQSNFDPCLNINRPPYYQSVYSCSGYPVEPYQQMFPWQSGSYLGQLDSATIYNVEIISGTEYAYFYKVGYWDTLSNVQVDPEYIGSSLTGLTGVELAGWGEYRVYQGIGVLEREHFALYNIRFDNFDLQTALVTVRITNTSTNIVTDWHTTIVNPQYTMQNLGIDGDTVLHNRSMIITPNISNSLALTCNQFGYGSCPPTNVTFNIEIIQGQEYGNIGKYNDFFGSFEYSPAYTGLSYDEFRYGFYVFEANGLQPDSTAVVRIRQSSSDTDIGSFEYTLNIKRNFLPPVSENGSIVIETNKNTAMPGDTLDILLKWEDGSNGIVDFSDWQEFGVWLADGFGYGTLLDPVTGDTSDAFEVTGKELKLIVHQDVTDANKKIVIAAETEVAVLGGNRMIQNNLQPKTETKSTDKKIISNYRTVEQGGFVKANNKMDKLDAVDKDDDDGEINIDIIIGSQYLSGVKEITVNPFIVEIDPPIVSAGDTARIIPKYVNETGDTVEFSSEQTFELGMLDGCVLGKLSSAGIDTNYFYGVTQPFYFIADSSADSGTVNIRVGVIDMNQQNRSITNNNNIIPEIDNPVSCANVSFEENLYANGIVVVGGCKQKTVICNNYQPPKLENVSSISILGENKPWNWKDDKGKNQNTSTGDACNYQMTNGCSDIMFGQTYIMPKIGDFASGTPPPPIYNRLDDMKIVVCLDKSDPNHQYWNFNIENLRVPIFTSHCPDEPANCYYVDLGDGSDATLLSQYIKNCTDYNKVMHVLKDYWVFGPERIGGLPYEKYYFSAGIIFHENHHVDQIEKYLYLILNSTGGLKQLANKRIEKNNQYKCPEDALNAKKQEIKELINDFLYMINDLKTLMNKNNTGKYISEIEADKVASLEYEKIKTRIQNWAIQQSWWCELRPIGIIGNPTFLDCGLIPCNP
nr:hypothetical protein [Ignavibacteriaceae bacterium]